MDLIFSFETSVDLQFACCLLHASVLLWAPFSTIDGGNTFFPKRRLTLAGQHGVASQKTKVYGTVIGQPNEDIERLDKYYRLDSQMTEMFGIVSDQPNEDIRVPGQILPTG
jgi:hypothetical protein